MAKKAANRRLESKGTTTSVMGRAVVFISSDEPRKLEINQPKRSIRGAKDIAGLDIIMTDANFFKRLFESPNVWRSKAGNIAVISNAPDFFRQLFISAWERIIVTLHWSADILKYNHVPPSVTAGVRPKILWDQLEECRQ